MLLSVLLQAAAGVGISKLGAAIGAGRRRYRSIGCRYRYR